MRLLAELYAVPWAIRPEALSAIIQFLERDDLTPEVLARAMHFDPAAQAAAVKAMRSEQAGRYAVHQRDSNRVEGTNGLYRRGTTAILPITGPIVRRGNMMSSMSGGPMTSVESLSRDFTRALEDDAFSSILLDVDSPGGEASGIAELADIIFAGRDHKLIRSYVSDLGASAGYWLASAAEELIVAPAAAVGSIGVVMAVTDPTAVKQTRIEFVSSMSPNKRPDVTTDEGKAEIQSMVDALGEIFVSAVARHRGVEAATVKSDFGAGGMLIGQAAVDAGMADRLGSLEATLRDLTEQTKPQPRALLTTTAEERTPGSHVVVAELPTAPPPASTTGALGAAMTNLRDRFMALLGELPVDATADQEALIMAQHAGDTQPQSETPQLASTPQPAPQLASGIVTSNDELQQRLRIAEAENSRLRLERITERAQAFAREQQDSVRALPTEIPSIVAIYTLLAQDDERYGPVRTHDGTDVPRTTYLANLFANRPSRKDLTEDVFGGLTLQVLQERNSQAKRDPNAEPDAARMRELLGSSAQGREVLDAMDRQAAAPNGSAR